MIVGEGENAQRSSASCMNDQVGSPRRREGRCHGGRRPFHLSISFFMVLFLSWFQCCLWFQLRFTPTSGTELPSFKTSKFLKCRDCSTLSYQEGYKLYSPVIILKALKQVEEEDAEGRCGRIEFTIV